jgi:hypothetical protein
MLERQNSLHDSDDSQLACHHSTILDALDMMELMEVDDDPNADQTNTDEDQLEEVETLDSSTESAPPKIPTPPQTISKKRTRGISAHILSVMC